MRSYTCLHPSSRFVEPPADDRLAISCGAQGYNGLQLFHALNHAPGAKRGAQAEAAHGLRLGGADDGYQILIVHYLKAPQMRIGPAVKDLPGIKLVADDLHMVLGCQLTNGANLFGGVDHTRGVVGVGENEQLYAIGKDRLQPVQIQTRSLALRSEIIQPHRDQLSLKEGYQLTVGKVVRFHNGDLVPMGNVCAHGQEKRALGPGGEDQLLIGIHGRSR